MKTTKEQAAKDILAWCLWVPERVMPKVVNRPKPPIFSDLDDQQIFNAMVSLYQRGEQIDLITVCQEMGKPGYTVEDRARKLAKLIDRPLIDETLTGKLTRKIAAIAGRSVLKEVCSKEKS